MTHLDIIKELVELRDMRKEFMRKSQRRAVTRLIKPDPAAVAEVQALKDELGKREAQAWINARHACKQGEVK